MQTGRKLLEDVQNNGLFGKEVEKIMRQHTRQKCCMANLERKQLKREVRDHGITKENI